MATVYTILSRYNDRRIIRRTLLARYWGHLASNGLDLATVRPVYDPHETRLGVGVVAVEITHCKLQLHANGSPFIAARFD